MKTLISTWLLVAILVAPLHAQKKNYILVHGGWQTGKCWYKVTPLLTQQHHTVLTPNLAGHGDNRNPATVTFDDYVASVVNAAQSVDGQVILVGHSMAGVVIAQAAEKLGKEKVERLVFLDAFMPDDGESVFSLAEKAGRLNAAKNIQAHHPSVSESLIFSADQKTSTLKMENVADLFYHDCSPSEIEYAKRNLCAQPMVCLATPVQVSAAVYGAIPKTYILCTQAHDLDKTSISNNVNCEKIITLDSSHSPFASMPEKLASILLSL